MKMESYVDLEQYLDTEDDALSLHLSSPIQSNTNIRHFCPPKQIIDEDEGSIPQNPFLPQSILSPSEAIYFQNDKTNNPIVSPPFAMYTPLASQAPNHRDSTSDISDFLSTVKKEIMEILSENVDLDNSTISSKADEVTLVHMMKTHNVLMNTLRKTCIHATHLQEEIKWLQEENSQLKVRLHLETLSHDRTPSMRSPQHDRNREVKPKDPSLYNLDTSDNYARRIYPEVSKSPGTVSGLLHYLYRNLSF